MRLSECEFWKPLIDKYNNELGFDLWAHPYRLNLGFIMAGREIDKTHQTRLRMMKRKLLFGAEHARLRWNLPLPGILTASLREASQSRYRLFEYLLRETSAAFIVDSSKHYLDALHLFNAAVGGAKIIHLIRDGRAVFASGLRRGLSRRSALSAWVSHSSRSIPLLKRHIPADHLLLVHYEKLADDTVAEISRIMNFLEFPFEDTMIDFTSKDSHILNGNRMRFATSSEIRLDEVWRNDLSDRDMKYFEARAGNLNRALGYE